MPMKRRDESPHTVDQEIIRNNWAAPTGAVFYAAQRQGQES